MPDRIKKISFVIPVYNEEGNIALLHEKMEKFLEQYSRYQFYIIFIDDGSSDQSVKAILNLIKSDMRVRLVCLSRNFGKESAITAGLSVADSDAAIIMDSDGQHPVELVGTFISYWEKGYKRVYGVQTSRTSETWIKRILLSIFYKYINYFSGINIPGNAGDFSLLDRCVMDALNKCQEKGRYMKGLYSWVGFKSTGIQFTANSRNTGKSKWSKLHLLGLALTAIVSFTNVPLRVWFVAGGFISFFSFCYAGYILFEKIVFGIDIQGYATTATAIFFFSGVQLLSIGVIGEYIANIFIEVKNRPQYIIAEKHGFECETEN